MAGNDGTNTCRSQVSSSRRSSYASMATTTQPPARARDSGPPTTHSAPTRARGESQLQLALWRARPDARPWRRGLAHPQRTCPGSRDLPTPGAPRTCSTSGPSSPSSVLSSAAHARGRRSHASRGRPASHGSWAAAALPVDLAQLAILRTRGKIKVGRGASARLTVGCDAALVARPRPRKLLSGQPPDRCVHSECGPASHPTRRAPRSPVSWMSAGPKVL